MICFEESSSSLSSFSSFPSSPPNLAHNMVASEDSMRWGNGHTNFCESCVKPVALGRLITIIFPRIYSRTYYAHPRARVMSFSFSADTFSADTLSAEFTDRSIQMRSKTFMDISSICERKNKLRDVTQSRQHSRAFRRSVKDKINAGAQLINML